MEGTRLVPNRAFTLPVGRTLPLVVAGSLSLAVHAHPRSQGGGVSPSSQAANNTCGIDHPHAIDACVITRPDNHSGMSYVMVLRRVTIGAVGAQVVIPGVAQALCEIAQADGRWVWRPAMNASWKPLLAGMMLEIEGQRLRVAPGSYEVFVNPG